MSDYNFSQLIKKSLLYYDKQNNKNKSYLKEIDFELNILKNEITFKYLEKKGLYNILGLFDSSTNIWIWGWMIPNYLNNEITYVKKLLDYGIKINIETFDENTIDKLYLKSQLTNSRFLLDNKIQLELHLAISSYLLKESFDFIWSKKIYLDNEKKTYLQTFYAIKI
jgi:hypothetical protein